MSPISGKWLVVSGEWLFVVCGACLEDAFRRLRSGKPDPHGISPLAENSERGVPGEVRSVRALFEDNENSYTLFRQHLQVVVGVDNFHPRRSRPDALRAAQLDHAAGLSCIQRCGYTGGMAPFLHLGPVTIPTYGLMVALGMLAAYYVLRADLARRGIAAQDSGMAELFIAVPGIAGIIGAKLYSVLETPRDFFADPFGQLFSRFGLTWYGGMVAGAATFAWLARRKKIPLLRMLDAGSPAASFGYAFGRMGCLLSGDGDYGIPTSLPWGMSFPNGLVPTTDHVHPTPIYESIVACLIAWVLWRLGARQIALGKIQPQAGPGSAKGGAKGSGAGQASSAGPPQGAIFGAYLALTGVARFLVEFIRINPRVLWGLTNAQIVGILCVIAGAVLWFRKERG